MSQQVFSDSSNFSFNDIRSFLNGKDGVNLSSQNISLNNLVSTSEQNDIALPNGDYVAPHQASEFTGATFSNIYLDLQADFAYSNKYSHIPIEVSIPSNIQYDYLEYTLENAWNGSPYWAKMSNFKLGSKWNYSTGQQDIAIQYGYVRFRPSTSGSTWFYWKPVAQNGVELVFPNGDEKAAWAKIKQIESSPSSYTLVTNDGTTLPSAGVDYELYVEMYQDLINAWRGDASGRSKSQFGQDHWNQYGLWENRNLPSQSFSNHYIMDQMARRTSSGAISNTLFFNSFDKPYINQRFGLGNPNYYLPNRATTTRAGGSYSYTVPNEVTSIKIYAVGGGGGSWGAHNGSGSYCQTAWAGGVGGGVILTLPVQSGDIISGVFGDAGGAGYYSGGTGGPGSATTVYKNGALVATCNPGGQGNQSPAQPGTASITSSFSSYGSTYTGLSQSQVFVGCDTSTNGNGYDPWNWIERGGRSIDQAGFLPFSFPAKIYPNFKVRAVKLPDNSGDPVQYFESAASSITVITDRFYGGRPQCNGYVKIEEL